MLKTKQRRSDIMNTQEGAFCCTMGLHGMVAILSVLYGSAYAKEIISGPITAEVVKVYDGDTIYVLAKPWPGILIKTKVRLRGIDTPEIRTKCKSEKDAAKLAKKALDKLIGGERIVHLHNVQLGKYAGRVIADVNVSLGDAATILINAGYGRPYDGGKRKSWCP